MKDAVRRSPRIPRHTSGEDSKNSGRSRSESREKSLPGKKRRRSLSEGFSTKKKNISQENIPAFQKVDRTHINGRLVDSYCWVCHQVTNDTFCERCPRRYHEACWDKVRQCECKKISVDGRTPEIPWGSTELKQLLEYAVQEAIKEKKKNSKKSDRDENDKIQQYFKNWPALEANESLNTIIDITVLIDKMNNDPYLNTGSFFSDVKWIHHNCYIVYGANHDITKTAMMLEKNFMQELTDIEACRECYINKHKQGTIRNNYFIELCHKLHTIVWAKMKKYPSWPAKCLKIHNGYADVRFFGTHEKKNILLEHVLKYSKEHPEKGNSTQKFKEAMQETEDYIANYENKYGTFQYFPKKTLLVDVITKKQPRKGRGRGGSYETPKKHRSEDSTVGSADKNEGCSTVDNNSAVEKKCFVRLDYEDIPTTDGNFDLASDKKKSSESLIFRVHKDPVEMKVNTALHQIPVCIGNFTERENEDAPNLRLNESFVVVNSNLDNLMSHEKEKNVGNKHVTHDSLQNPPPTSLLLDNPSNISNFSDSSSYTSGNSNQLVNSNVENCSNPSYSNSCLPVITSTIGHVDSQVRLKDFRSPTCDTLANLLNIKSVPKRTVSEIHNFSNNIGENQQEDNDSDEEDDDECQILPESETLPSTTQMGLTTKNAAICKAFTELILSNRRDQRKSLEKWLNFSSALFMKLALEASETCSFQNIQEVYAKCLNTINSLEADKQKLIAENKQLKEDLDMKISEINEQNKKKDLLRDMVDSSVSQQIDELKQALSASKKFTEAYEMELVNKNKEIEELKENITNVLKCDKECQFPFEHVDDLQIMNNYKDFSKNSFEEQEFPQIENFNEMGCNTEQQQDIAEAMQFQSFNSFPFSNLQFQNHNETTSATSQIYIEQIAGSSSNVLCERRNLIMSDSTTYVTQSVPMAPPVVLQLSTALPTEVNTYSTLEGAEITQSSVPKRKPRQIRKSPSTSQKTIKGNKKNG